MSYAAHSPLINYQPDRLSRGAALARSIAGTLRLWRTRNKERHAFPVLDERELRDMRVSRFEVERELAKPFWRG